MIDLGMTQEDLREMVLDRAAQKLADDAARGEYIVPRVQVKIDELIAKVIAEKLTSRIDEVLTSTLEEQLNTVVTPVDIFGERVGEPTTIRETLSARAKNFWDTKVDSRGKPTNGHSYHNKTQTRAEFLIGQMVSENFLNEIKTNATAIAATLKETIRKDAHEMIDKHINSLVR